MEQLMINPFLKQEKYYLELIEIFETRELKIDTLKNKEVIHSGIEYSTKKFYTEAKKKTNVYQISYVEQKIFKELTSAARDILLYIIYRIPEKRDFINLKYCKLVDAIGSAKPTIARGLKNLQDNNIIYKKSQSEYWVNPFYIFKGDKLQFFQENGYEEFVKVVKTIRR